MAETAGFRLEGPERAGEHVRRADNHSLVPPEDQLIARALRGELADQEMLWVGPPGKRVALAASSRQVLRPDGTAWGTLLAAHDVTDLARALQLEEDFISTVADELLTPLSAMLGHVELLLDDVEGHDVDLERTARRIHGAAIKLSNRMTELLDVADGRRKLDLRPTDLAGLTRSVVASFTAQAMARGITRLHGQRRPHSGSGCSVLHRSPQPALVVVPRAAPLTGVHSELSEHHGRSWRIEPCCSSSWRN